MEKGGRHVSTKGQICRPAMLDSGSEEQPPALANLTRELQALAVQTDVRYLPDYPPPSEGRLVSALGTIQDGKRQLIPGDRLVIETEDKVYEVDIGRDWSPSTAADEGVETETSSYGEMILTIRKPDTIGNTQWQFKHGKQNISAPIYDNEWLRKYHERKLDIRPGDALRCRIKFVYAYDKKTVILNHSEWKSIRYLRLSGVHPNS